MRLHEDTEKLLAALDKWVDNKTIFNTSLEMINKKLNKNKVHPEIEAAALSVFKKTSKAPFKVASDVFIGSYEDKVF